METILLLCIGFIVGLIFDVFVVKFYIYDEDMQAKQDREIINTAITYIDDCFMHNEECDIDTIYDILGKEYDD